ncbi:HNH endonuclease family protein [Rhodococcus sp. NPDC058514]|uniref:HNH endonuclease family protein n=1 Tax=unclassified Rhodococcus (in: high G+C Gram-positive bacteria) TaxID=192944 RepID=UPI0036686535
MGFRGGLGLVVVLAVALLVAIGLLQARGGDSDRPAAGSGAVSAAPSGDPATDPLAGIAVVDKRTKVPGYDRGDFGPAWTDDTDAPLGHNGCDTRNDILERDLVDRVNFDIWRCPWAVRSGTLHDPYSGAVIAFQHGDDTSNAVQIDHIVSLALAWDMGANTWPPERRARFANDPANLIAVAGEANFAKASHTPAGWMPPNEAFRCDYAHRFTSVLREYGLPVDRRSADALRGALRAC